MTISEWQKTIEKLDKAHKCICDALGDDANALTTTASLLLKNARDYVSASAAELRYEIGEIKVNLKA